MAAANPGYDKFKLNAEIGNLWKTDVDEDLEEFLEEAAEVAKQELAV